MNVRYEKKMGPLRVLISSYCIIHISIIIIQKVKLCRGFLEKHHSFNQSPSIWWDIFYLIIPSKTQWFFFLSYPFIEYAVLSDATVISYSFELQPISPIEWWDHYHFMLPQLLNTTAPWMGCCSALIPVPKDCRPILRENSNYHLLRHTRQVTLLQW